MIAHQNRLARETSPYLLQHAANPVDWYPWSAEALDRAKTENKPIFLSIGYSACHWCHVMERESFENEAIAEIMNRYFVNIKVDREERPDLDDYFMMFVQMTTGSGGWPMSVFLTPDGKPFFGGTYFPPEDAYSRRGFAAILHAVAKTWEKQRQRVLDGTASLLEMLKTNLTRSEAAVKIDPGIVDTAVEQMLERYDPVDGGFGEAPKFPPSYALSLMMRQYYRQRDARVLHAITHTLNKMAAGGIYDQLGGGFHRYSTDAHWLVPHFEKMLYDNALLAVTYCEAFQLTQNTLYRQVACDTLDYLLRDMRDPVGGFYSSEDADSEGVEGKFYVWTPEEVITVLGSEDGKLFCDYYDVTNAGNFEGRQSILHVRADIEQFAKEYKMTPGELNDKLASLRLRLLQFRATRVRPPQDDKVLAEWNGLMLSALCKGYQATANVKYLDAAVECASFIEKQMYSPSGLLRIYRRGQAKQPGFLSDYAFIANGLIDLYESSFDIHWLKFAEQLAQEMISNFADADHGGFFTTRTDQLDLPIRQKDSYDGAVPSGNSAAAIVLLRLAVLLDKKQYRGMADQTIATLGGNIEKMPTAYMNMLNAYDLSQNGSREIAIIGRRSDVRTLELIRTAHSMYLPHKTVALLDPGSENAAETQALLPLLQNRKMIDGKATACVCRDYSCRLPVTTVEDLVLQLNED